MSRPPPLLPPGRASPGVLAPRFPTAPGAPAPPRAPPAPASSRSGGGDEGGGSASAPSGERSALLSQIHQGARLRKTVTNDRSAPAINGAKNSSSSCGPAGGGSQATAFPKAMPGLGGGPRPPIGKFPALQPPHNAAKTTPMRTPAANVRGPPGPPQKSTPTPAAPRGNARWPPPAPGKR